MDPGRRLVYLPGMPERHVHPLVKLLLEVGPIGVFFLAYRWAPVPDGLADAERQLQQILFATAVFVPAILASLAASYALTRKLPRMAVITAVVVTIFGGPSFLSVEQDIVNDFDFSESYPYDTATFTRAIATSQSESAVGVNVGGDVAYFFTPNVGVGGTAQYSGATVEMTTPSGTADVKAGGLQVGGGIRLRF